MVEWLLLPIDLSRDHVINGMESWHARLMFFAWAVMSPIAVIVARFFKILPTQKWPLELDSQVWWKFHWISQTIVFVISIASMAFMVMNSSVGRDLHGLLGITVGALLVVQVVFGVCRGSKGGPTESGASGSLFGDHYNMTRWRLAFEFTHKTFGYMALFIASSTIVVGLWNVNAPRGLWLFTVLWWATLIVSFVVLQCQHYAVDTYQAIWGPDKRHPGNKLPSSGWGTTRRNP